MIIKRISRRRKKVDKNIILKEKHEQKRPFSPPTSGSIIEKRTRGQSAANCKILEKKAVQFWKD